MNQNQHVHTHQRPVSPSIADQLLMALNAREKKRVEPEEELSRQCAEELLGKRNAFVPELRMNHVPSQDEAITVQELIQNRLRVESQVDTLRQQKQKHKEKAQIERAPGKIRAPFGASAAADVKAQREAVSDRKSSAPQFMRTKLFELEEFSRPSSKRDAKQTRDEKTTGSHRSAGVKQGHSPDMAVSNNVENGPRGSARSSSRDGTLRAVSRGNGANSDPLKQMEERQQRLHEMRAARAAKKEHDNPASDHDYSSNDAKRAIGDREETHSNQEDDVYADRYTTGTSRPRHTSSAATRDERLLQEKIKKLAIENQQAIEIEEQTRRKQQLRKLQARVFSTWKRQSAARKLQDARARQVFEWRLVQKVWRNWRQISQTMAIERVEQETRARLAREKQMQIQADAFWCQRQLPKWFFRWLTSVQARKEVKELEIAQQKRKAQAQELVERLIRNQSRQPEDNDGEHGGGHINESSPDSAELEIDIEIDGEEDVHVPEPLAERMRPPKKDRITTTTHVAEHQHRKSKAPQTKTAWGHKAAVSSSPSQSSVTKSPPPPPPVDPLYVSMQERAAERKRRRDLLKQKYEHLEQEKREVMAMQVAECEAQLLKAKLEERERVRERKRHEALVAQDKMLRIEALEVQRRQARRHDYKRLVFYYGFLPLKRQWELSKRIAAHATQWHALRVLHNHWHHWLRFVHDRHVEQQQIERQKLEIAAKHHARVLKHQSLQGFKTLHQRMLSMELAVQRQSEWNALRRAWSSWQRTYTIQCMQQHAQERQAVVQLNAKRLRRVWLQWRLAVAELREERERQQEKQRLWGKVRDWLNE